MTPKADLLIENALPWSDGAPLKDADAIAIGGGRVLAVGRRADLAALADARTERLDAAGATVTPGITDAHIHLVAWARARTEVSLHDLPSAAACVARVREALAAGGTGALVGRGWDANDWPEPPHRAQLDALTLDRPLLLHSRDYHALWVNSAALVAADITRDTADPAGGRFERDGSGALTGVIREHAVRAFAPLEPRNDESATAEQLADASRALLALGITAVHDFEDERAFRALRRLTTSEGPRVRVLMYLAHAGLDHALAIGLASGVGDAWFRVGGVKLFADGTLGSRTAAMLEPYAGTGQRGMDLLSKDELRDVVGRALEGGLAVAVHAIGDRAARHVIEAVEAAGPHARRPALRSRIEHLQLAAPGDVARLARAGLVASMQPTHCTTDMTLAERHWGARCAHAYPWKEVLQERALLAFGSDAPVEPPDPSAGLFAALTRQRPDGSPPAGWIPEQRIALDPALEAFTGSPAALSDNAGALGTLRAGAVADLVVWDRDLHRSDPQSVRTARPAVTLLEGAIVFRSSDSNRSAVPPVR